LKLKKLSIRLTFTEPLLGTVAMDKQLYSRYVASLAPEKRTDDELETVPDLDDISRGFHRDDAGRPLVYDYVVKGFFKDALSMLKRDSTSPAAAVKAHKKVIDGMVFVEPRRIPLVLPPGGEITWLERPLRAQTAQGERIALARSECAPAGTSLAFAVVLLGTEFGRDLLEECLAYGSFRGLGQWRNASYGRFDYEIDA
jgi:hypothetical protein